MQLALDISKYKGFMTKEPVLWRQRLKQGIADAGLKQSEVAQRLNLSKSTVSRWLSGTMAPEGPHRIAIARLLNMSERWLFPDLDPPASVAIPPEQLIIMIGDEVVRALDRRKISIDPAKHARIISMTYEIVANTARPQDGIPAAVERVLSLIQLN